MRSGLNFRVIFIQVHFCEVQRLKLFRREAATHRLFGRAPADAIERFELRATLFLENPAELGVEAAMTPGLLQAQAEKAGGAIVPDLVAHARAPQHRGFHVLLVAPAEQQLDHEVDSQTYGDRGWVEADDQRSGTCARGLAGGCTGLECRKRGAHPVEHALHDGDLGADRAHRRPHPILDDLAFVTATILEGVAESGRPTAHAATAENLDPAKAIACRIDTTIGWRSRIIDRRYHLNRCPGGVGTEIG